MTTQTAPAPTDTPLDEVTTHVYCCTPDWALCGHDISQDPEVDGPTPTDCIVCLALEPQPCPRCGYQPDDTA